MERRFMPPNLGQGMHLISMLKELHPDSANSGSAESLQSFPRWAQECDPEAGDLCYLLLSNAWAWRKHSMASSSRPRLL